MELEDAQIGKERKQRSGDGGEMHGRDCYIFFRWGSKVNADARMHSNVQGSVVKGHDQGYRVRNWAGLFPSSDLSHESRARELSSASWPVS